MTLPPLAPHLLRRSCDPRSLDFETTSDLEDLRDPLGQARAVEATRFAISMGRPGYNVFVLGPSGAGKHALLRELLTEAAADRPTPPDWVYVHNFKKPDEPRSIRLPAGVGRDFARDMERLIEELRTAITTVFDSPEYTARVEQIQTEFKEKQEELFSEIEEAGKKQGIAVVRAPIGVVFAPVKDGEVVTPDEFEKLDETERKRLKEAIEELQSRLHDRLKQLPRLQKQAREKVRQLDREVTRLVVEQAIEDLLERYSHLPKVIEYLQEVRDDVTDNADEFRKDDESPKPFAALKPKKFERYGVNLFVDNAETHGAPVVYDDHGSHEHLVGRIEHYAELGNLVTNFMMIKPGSLHRAGGGFLMVDARKILTNPYAWEGLKRTLFAGKIQIEPLSRLLGLSSTVSLKPEPIPVDLKVVLFGSRRVFYLLSQLDSDFHELFKVEADFEDTIERSEEHHLLMSRSIATLARRLELRPLDRTAVARIVDESSRTAGDATKLSTHSRWLVDLLQESDHWAEQRGSDVSSAEDVQKAIDTQIRQRDRIRERMREAEERKLVLIDVSGERVGHVNGLAAISLGNFTFGRPSRITATARIGEGKVIDIEREVELGGPLHSKGVLILSNYLAARYSRDYPLSLSASVVFEQSYSSVEGDSASLAELCALLSALANVPIRQSLAVTGSVNQWGQVQAIGAVNEKVEGFFDACKRLGFSGEQGVVVPKSNVDHLMLRQEVADAAADGKFRVYTVETVDEAMEVLTGGEAGKANEDGEYPEGSLNARIEEQLMGFAIVAKRFAEVVQLAEKNDGDDKPGTTLAARIAEVRKLLKQ